MAEIKPGDALPVIRKTIDQERIMRWARISGDYNRLHVDREYAAQTRFKSTIAHGPMSLAFLNELMMEYLGLSWAEGGRLLNVRFVAPIRPGDDIEIGGTVSEVEADGPHRLVRCELYIKNSRGEQAVRGEGHGRLDRGAGS